MVTVYVDEDLTTGLDDGSSWANAYQSWAGMVTGEAGTLTDDLTIYFRSDGTVGVNRSLSESGGWDSNGYNIYVRGDSDAIMSRGVTWSEAFNTDVDDLHVYDLTFQDARHGAQTNGSRQYFYSCTSKNNSSSGFYKSGDTGSGGATTYYNCIAVDNTTSGFNVQAYRNGNYINCYGGGNGDDYLTSTAYANYNLTTSASSDTTGNSGLQNIPYSTATFVSVTSGSEDLHTVTGSDLRGEGTGPSVDSDVPTPDPDGNVRSGATCDIGVYEFVGGVVEVVIEPDITEAESVTAALYVGKSLIPDITEAEDFLASLKIGQGLTPEITEAEGFTTTIYIGQAISPGITEPESIIAQLVINSPIRPTVSEIETITAQLLSVVDNPYFEEYVLSFNIQTASGLTFDIETERNIDFNIETTREINYDI